LWYVATHCKCGPAWGLDWAARHEVGHRALLQLGGTELIASAVRAHGRAAPARLGFGEELADLLGREAAVKLVKTALRLSTEALRGLVASSRANASAQARGTLAPYSIEAARSSAASVKHRRTVARTRSEAEKAITSMKEC
jgi:hypothetical protein